MLDKRGEENADIRIDSGEVAGWSDDPPLA